MGMNSKVEMKARKETASVEEKVLELFAPAYPAAKSPA